MSNVLDGDDGGDGNDKTRISHKMTPEELKELLKDREEKLQNSTDGGITDQWRVYTEIVGKIQAGEWLRMMVQASAGTGNLDAPKRGRRFTYSDRCP